MWNYRARLLASTGIPVILLCRTAVGYGLAYSSIGDYWIPYHTTVVGYGIPYSTVHMGYRTAIGYGIPYPYIRLRDTIPHSQFGIPCVTVVVMGYSMLMAT